VGNYFEKQQSSQVIKNQQISWTGPGTAVSTNFTAETFQVRQVAGSFSIDNSGGPLLGTAPSTAGGAGTYIAANVVGEYWVCRPGQIFTFSSTSTSSGTISISECA
jgi:hypothetical protein